MLIFQYCLLVQFQYLELICATLRQAVAHHIDRSLLRIILMLAITFSSKCLLMSILEYLLTSEIWNWSNEQVTIELEMKLASLYKVILINCVVDVNSLKKDCRLIFNTQSLF